ncbi:MAG: patatin-like phospholipase family protein [Bacillota bacterium]
MKDYQPTIGLALGAGGARGLAHVGVLKFFEEEKIDIDIIAGTSIGSIVGGLYSAGIPVKYMEKIAEEIDWDTLTDVTFPRKGLIKGNKILKFFEVLTQNKNFSDLNIPFSAIACDIENGEHVVINSGSVAKAIRSSIAIPGIFVPFNHQDRLMVDGAVLDRVPVSTVRKMGADIIIAVDIKVRDVNNKIDNIFDVLFNTFDIMQYEFQKLKDTGADITINPKLEDVDTLNLDNTALSVNEGYQEAKKYKEEIESILGRVNNEKK